MKKIFSKLTMMALLVFCVVITCKNTSTVNAATTEAPFVLEVQENEDVSVKIQKAIKAGEKYIVVPSGRYTCTKVSLNGVDGITIELQSDTTIVRTGTYPMVYVSDPNTAKNITIKGGIWDGNGAEAPIMRFLGNVDGITISDVTIKNSGDCGFKFKNSKNVTINNAIITDCKSYAFYCEGVNTITVTQSKMNASKNGIGLVTCAGKINISNTECSSNTGYGVYANDCDQVTLSQVTASGNNAGVRLDKISTTISMKYVYAKKNTLFGVKIYQCTAKVSLSRVDPQNNGNSGLVLEECTGNATLYKVYSYTNGSKGIDVKNCGYVKIDSCVVKTNTGYGINVDGNKHPEGSTTALRIVGTTVQSNKNIGIRVVNMPDKNDRVYIDKDTKSLKNSYAGFYAQNVGYIVFTGVTAQSNKGFGINVNDVTSITVTTATVTANTDTGIRLNSCGKVKLTDVTANTNVNAGLRVSASKNVTIANLNVEGNNGYGVNFSTVTGTNALSGIVATKNTNSGMIFSDSTGITLDSTCSSVENGAHGIYVTNSTITLNQVTVKTNYWCGLSASGAKASVKVNGGLYYGNGTRPDRFEDDDNLCAGIGIYGGAKAVITEATCNYNHGCGITAAGEEDGSLVSTITVYGCTANNNDDHGIGARPYGKINVTKSANGVKNQICNNKHTGFIINDHCKSDYVQYCVIKNNGKAGISISKYSTATKISNNTVQNNAEDGIHVSENSTANIYSCKVSGNALSGLGIYSGSKVSKLQNSSFTGNEHYGVCLESSKLVSALNITISKNVWAGINLRSKSEITLIKDSSSTENKTYGLYVSAGSIINTENCTFDKNTLDGIRATGSGSIATITGGSTSECAGNGITATDKAAINVTEITVSNNTGYGIYVANGATAGAITNASVSGSGKDGIRVTGSGSSAIITDGSVTNGVANGLTVTDSAKMSVTGTEITGNKGYGIYIANGATADALTNVVVKTSGKDGIRITGSKTKAVTISGCTVSNNAQCGLIITDSAKVTYLKSSSFTGNKKHGVAIYKGTTVSSASTITSKNNSEYQIYVQEGANTKLKSVK